MAPTDKNKTLGASSSAKKDGKINASLNICKIKNIMRSLQRISLSNSSTTPPKNVSNISSHIDQGSSSPYPSNLTSSRGTSSNESESKSNYPTETARIAYVKSNTSPIISLNATNGQDTSSTTSSVHEAILLLHNNDPAAVLPEDNTDRALPCESLVAVVNNERIQSLPGAIHVDGLTAAVCSSLIGRNNIGGNPSIRPSDKSVLKGRDKTYTLLKEIEENFRMSLSPEGKVDATACSLPDRSADHHTSPVPAELVVVKATAVSASKFASSPNNNFAQVPTEALHQQSLLVSLIIMSGSEQPEGDLPPSSLKVVPSTKRSLLRRSDGTDLNDRQVKRIRKSVHFDEVTVYNFPRTQGFQCIPTKGGTTLGMSMNHGFVERFSLAEHVTEERRIDLEMLRKQPLSANSSQGQLLPVKDSGLKEEEALSVAITQTQSSDDSDRQEESDSNLDVKIPKYHLKPLNLRQRQVLLREAGVHSIDPDETKECQMIRTSREVCGCKCTSYCDPDSCPCAQDGIKCLVDHLNFPCGCTAEGCGNQIGRTEYNPTRVRAHFTKTLTRIEEEKKHNEQYSPGVIALRDIRKYQKSTELLIPKLPFYRLVKEVVQGLRRSEFRFQCLVVEALQCVITTRSVMEKSWTPTHWILT
ncbi:unnamed protein product [Orchesella dallaii]|uniref:Cysteine/serine-rich nuclear protein N-terminal domain-containing protein n=1 Tax=Orchesella dallaii TaxID=48710 RepID=A0ABP1R5L0_9HEXA